MSAQIDPFVHHHLPTAQNLPDFVFEGPHLQLPEKLNLVEALFRQATAMGQTDAPCLRSDQLTLSYAQVQQRVQQIAVVLTTTHRLVPGNRVLLRGGNSIGMALAWLGVVSAGLVAVATMPLLRARELKVIIEKSAPSLALCDAKLQEELLLTQLALPTVLFGANGEDKELGFPTEAFAPPCATLGTDIALIAFTSGTTGAPKAAVHTHRDIWAACEAWPRHVLKPRPNDIVVGTPPLAFTFGLGGLLIFPLWAGASVYFPSSPYNPANMVETIARVGATICFTAPTFYRQMAQHLHPGKLPTLRDCVSAGEALPVATRTLFKQASGLELLDGIGATEMFHIFVSSRASDTVVGAIGQVVPGYEAKVVDEQGNELPRGQVGKLAVRGPTGCKYLDDARQSSYVRGGWNYPGDAFYQDTAGNFFYQARTDDMIITSGYNVGAADVEDVLMTHSAVAECGVVGVADEERGMVIHAFVLLRAGFEGDAAMTKLLQDHVKQHAAPYKYPRRVSYVSVMPRTETGKLQRFRLRDLLKEPT
jgi:2-aminobenzoate-CoA ligase